MLVPYHSLQEGAPSNEPHPNQEDILQEGVPSNEPHPNQEDISNDQCQPYQSSTDAS